LSHNPANVLICSHDRDSRTKWGLLEAWDKTVIEEPPGEKQIDYHENSNQWVPRGDVLRCIIDDGGPSGEVTVHVDD
jgi:hypothetical protein